MNRQRREREASATSPTPPYTGVVAYSTVHTDICRATLGTTRMRVTLCQQGAGETSSRGGGTSSRGDRDIKQGGRDIK